MLMAVSLAIFRDRCISEGADKNLKSADVVEIVGEVIVAGIRSTETTNIIPRRAFTDA